MNTWVEANIRVLHRRPGAILVAVLACAWPALFLSTVCLFPYLNKPFVVDDPLFLMMAQQIVKQPTHPLDFTVCWDGVPGCAKASGSPLMGEVNQGYALVPTVLTGAHEWAAHLTELILGWIAILAMTGLVLRLGWDRWHATVGALLLVAIPPFLPMASTAMPDILATALALLGMERLAAWNEEQKWSRGAAAGIALGLAGFARPHLSMLLPLGAFFLLARVRPKEFLVRIRQQYWLWAPIAAGCGIFGILILALREHVYAITTVPASLEHGHLRDNLYTFLLYFTFPLPLAASWIANRLSAGRWRSTAIVLLVATAPLLLRLGIGLILLPVILGLSALISLCFETAKRRDHFGLTLMLWVLIPLPIVFYSHLPIKYLLPCVPAVILLCFRLLDDVSVRFARAAVIVLIVAGTGYSLLILRADAEFAYFGRDALFQLIKPHVEAGEKVWYGGQYWSYWYAPLAGATLTYVGGPQPRAGDLFVVDVIADGESSPLKRFPHRTLVEAVSHNYRFGRTVGGGIGGLYSGFWLWTTGNRLTDRYELWRIE